MKKIISTILTTTFLANATIFATPVSYDLLASMNIMTYYQGDFQQDDYLTRAMLSKILVQSSSYKYELQTSNTSPFSDVKYTHWCSPYVSTAVKNSLLNGYLDGTFRPENILKLEEAVTSILNLLGYTSFQGTYPSSQMSYAENIGLLKGITKTVGSNITRADMAILLCNMFDIQTSNGTVYSKTLGYDSFDLSSVIEKEFESAITVTSAQNFSEYKIYVDGNSATSVPIGSLAYINANSKIVFAYTEKVSGIINSILPNKESPTSIVLSGKTYQLSTTSAKEKVALNGYTTGDYIICSIDRNGAIADISTNVDYTVTGVVLDSGLSDEYDGYYIEIITTTGNTFKYPATQTYEKGEIISISNDLNIQKISNKSTVIGKIDNKSLGGYSFSNNLKIIDVSDKSEVSYPSFDRLNGIQLEQDDILYININSNNEITELILNNVTHDLVEYVYLKEITEKDANFNVSTSYQYDLNGSSKNLSLSLINSNVKIGPSYIVYSDDATSGLVNLKEETQEYQSIIANKVYFKSSERIISDNVICYKIIDNQPVISTIDNINLASSVFYYDDDTVNGGAIRIICQK